MVREYILHVLKVEDKKKEENDIIGSLSSYLKKKLLLEANANIIQ